MVMREIKFRGYDVHDKKIVDWNDIWENKGYLYDYMNGVVGNLIPMQYTGLKDKNGVDIYEGDIIKPWAFNKKSGNAYHSNFPPKEIKWLTAKKKVGWNIVIGERYEVIGNIYENK